MTRNRNARDLAFGFGCLRWLPAGGRRRKRTVRRANCRFLRIESCEERNLLASVSGTVFDDLTGDGLTADDVPTSEPVTLQLFRDSDNGDGVFNEADDDLFGETTTGAGGTYGFDGLTDGLYFLRQVVPSGAEQTAPDDLYTFQVVNDVVFTGTGLVVDTFEDPANPSRIYRITYSDPDPTLIKTEATADRILGGERDLLVDVLGTARLLSASGEIGLSEGSGNYNFLSASPGTMATLQYDGVDDLDIETDPGPPAVDAGLVNAEGLSADLTDGGVNTGLRLDFDLVQLLPGPGLPTELDFEIRATSPGGSATFTGAVPESSSAFSQFVRFAEFLPAGDFSFEGITSLEFAFNQDAVETVDFSISGINADRPAFKFDFANLRHSSLSGYVYVDINDDGFRAPSELPIPNTTITLVGVDDRGDSFNGQTTTDAAGLYLFADLRPGLYTIHETQPAAYLDGKDTQGTPGNGVTSNDQFSAIQLPAGFDGEENNFGERGEKRPSKRSFIYPFGNWDQHPDGAGNPPDAGAASVQGAEGANLVEFVAQNNPGFGYVSINGQLRPLEPETGVFHYDGSESDDTVVLTGTDGDETLVLGPDYATFVGERFAVTVTHVESITVDGRGGNDTATVYDSPGDDTLAASPSWVGLTGPELTHEIIGFETLHGHATAGGFDVGFLYDSAGDDLLAAAPSKAMLFGDGYHRELNSFDNVHAYATAGGFDVAKLFDSRGDDTFFANSIQGAVFGKGYLSRAKFFEQVHAYATAGGHDVAELYDSPGDDTFIGNTIHGVLFGPGYLNRAKHFEEVHAHATEGHDEAELYDSAGDDYLEAAADWVRLSYGGKSHRAAGFDSVRAVSSQGGTDAKHVEAVDFLLLTDGVWPDD